MNNLQNVVVIIPSFRPPKDFPELCIQLKALGFTDIVVVNDGSPPEYKSIFLKLKSLDINVVELTLNQGKGEALRKGIKYALKHFQSNSFIFCDDDGQHLPVDVAKVALFGLENQAAFVIGSRDIKKMPFKSFLGNVIIKFLLKSFRKINIPDTQSGLRFLDRECTQHLLNVESERFSFELVSLLVLHQEHVLITTYPIETIYFNNNKTTRFNPITDSIDVIRSMLSSPSKRK